jgi:hypothetical protein
MLPLRMMWYRWVGDERDGKEQEWAIWFTYQPPARATRSAPAEGDEIEIRHVVCMRDVHCLTGDIPVSEWQAAYRVTDAELAEVEQKCLEYAQEDDSHEPEWEKPERFEGAGR